MASSYRKYFKKEIVSKLKHIFNTSTRGKGTFNLPGCGHSVRTRLELKHFQTFFEHYFCEKDLNESIAYIEKLFEHGIVVVLRNEDYFELKKSENPLHKLLLERLSSDNIISSVIHIESKTSNSKDIVPYIEEIRKETNLRPLQKKSDKMKHMTLKGVSSNTHWEGHYAIISKGGTNKSICEGNIPLGNPIYDYADEHTSESIEYQMVYMMLCSENAKILLNDETKFEEVKEFYKKECEKRGLLDFTKFAPSTPIDQDGNLHCCILNGKIKAEHFFLLPDHRHSVQYCHIQAKTGDCIEIVDGRIQTIFRPYNIAWGHQWANRSQNDMTIAEIRELIDEVRVH